MKTIQMIYKIQIYLCMAVTLAGIPFLEVYPLTAIVCFVMGMTGVIGAIIDRGRYKAWT